MFEKRPAIDNPFPHTSLKFAGWRFFCAFRDALLPSRCQSCGSWIPEIDSPHPRSGSIESLFDEWAANTESKHDNGMAAAALHEGGLSGLKGMLCEPCRQHIVTVEPPLCIVCGRMFDGGEGADHRCGNCIRHSRHFSRVRSALIYTSGFRKVLHHYKYRGRIRLAAPLGDILLATFLRFWNSDDMDLILPVPLHQRRLRQRGFNQAYRLMANWKQFDGNLAPTPHLLVKKRATAPQTGLGKTQRRRNIHHAFDVRRSAAVRSRRILLVDDVYTTGATADECARVLMHYGAARVDVLTLARAVRTPSAAEIDDRWRGDRP